MKKMSPAVFIILLNWNNRKDTMNCIDSINRLDYPNFKVVVVDNGSIDGSPEIIKKKFPMVHLIRNKENLGFSIGNNVGIRYALRRDAKYVFVLNNDTILDKNCLRELVKVAESDLKIGIVGPKIYIFDGSQNRIWFAGGKTNWWKGEAKHIGFNEEDEGQYDVVKEVDFITGCALLIKRKVIKEIGLFDPFYSPIYFEDADWCSRARRDGYKIVYVPKAKLWHKKDISIRKHSHGVVYLVTRNRLLFMRKNAEKIHLPMFLIYFFIRFFVLKIIYFLITLKAKCAQAIIDGVVDFIRYYT